MANSGVRIEDNLFWENQDGDLEDSASCFPDDWADHNFFGDPMFCDPEGDDFTVSENSPALTSGTPIGAFWEPGCGQDP